MRATTLAVLMFTTTGPIAFAADRCPKLLGGTAVSNLIQDYDLRFHVVAQTDPALNLSEVGCGMVCAINLMQGLRVAAGAPPIADPVARLNQATEDSRFQEGLRPSTFRSFLGLLEPGFLPNQSLTIESHWLNPSPRGKAKKIMASDLKSGPTIAQVLLLMPFTSDDASLRDGHWVLLTSDPSASRATVKISDPNYARAELEMNVESDTFNFPGGRRVPTLRLTPRHPSVARYYDDQYGTGSFFMIWSLITVSLEDAPAPTENYRSAQ